MLVRAHRERVEVARQGARRVGQRLAAESCSSSGVSAIAVPPRCAIATENDTRVRVECFEK